MEDKGVIGSVDLAVSGIYVAIANVPVVNFCHLVTTPRVHSKRRKPSAKGEKMSSAKKFACRLPVIFFLAGCNGVSGSYPFLNPTQPISLLGAPSSSPTVSSPPATTSQRSQYAWEKALEGMVMGGAFGGIYGAGGGLVIGLLTGLFTADAHYAQRTTQIQTEQAKDKLLETKIEQELERQRQLEAQLLRIEPNQAQQNQANRGQRVGEPAVPVLTPASTGPSDAIASLSKKESVANSPSRPFKNVEVRDINRDGIPDLWIYYSLAQPGEIVRQEEATKGDGRVDTWSYFKDGKLVRREIDSRGKGVADIFYYYENEKLVREERDELGKGQANFRAFYRNDRLAKIEKDSNGTGKIDRWTYYDTSQSGEIVSREEQDLNGDGIIDLWSHYENGRLVRRDLNAVGLELVSQQNAVPTSSTAAPKPISQSKPRDKRG
jgi:hypothetical protein